MLEIEVQMYKFKEQILKADWGKVAPGQEKPTEEEIHAEVRKMAEAGMKKFMEVQIPLQRGLFFVFTLPPEAVLLATGDVCTNQAFEYKDHVLGLQFHIEYSKESIEKMLVHCGDEIVPAPFVQNSETIRAGYDTLSVNTKMLYLVLDVFARQH